MDINMISTHTTKLQPQKQKTAKLLSDHCRDIIENDSLVYWLISFTLIFQQLVQRLRHILVCMIFIALLCWRVVSVRAVLKSTEHAFPCWHKGTFTITASILVWSMNPCESLWLGKCSRRAQFMRFTNCEHTLPKHRAIPDNVENLIEL